MLSVIAQTFWAPQVVCDVGARDFVPAPKVASRVLKFQRRQVRIESAQFLKFVKTGFAHRRKLLFRNLEALHSKESLEKAFTTLELERTGARAEELSPEEFVRLHALVQGKSQA